MSIKKKVLREVRNVLSQPPHELLLPVRIFMGEIFLSKDLASINSASLEKQPVELILDSIGIIFKKPHLCCCRLLSPRGLLPNCELRTTPMSVLNSKLYFEFFFIIPSESK